MVRGGFHPAPEDGVPAGYETVFIIGNAGPALWQAFGGGDLDAANPLDEWTKKVIGRVAETFGAKALYPFEGPPYHPFQKWAMKADDVSVSPIGPLIHPKFGLWHAYRGVLLFSDRLEIPPTSRSAPPCTTCEDRPCLSTCPVDAFSETGYDVPACRAHIGSEAGSDCLTHGCLARRACPVGRDYIYDAPQAEFHMQRFLTAK